MTSQHSGKKTVVVIGGTGEYGGSVALSLNDNPAFHVRVTTRDPTTEKAQKKSAAGIEVVKADSWESEELGNAFKGAWGLYVNTDSDDPNFKAGIGPPESEMGTTIIDAAKKAGVKHFVYAGLPEASRVTNGEVPILSFDTKHFIFNYAKKAGFETATRVNAGWALENFEKELYRVAFGGFHTFPDDEGNLTLKVFPMGNDPEIVPWTAVRDDYGDQVHAVFLDPARYNGGTYWLLSDPQSFQALPDAYNKWSGIEKARYVPLTGRMTASTPGKTKEVNGLHDYCHWVKGNYLNGEPAHLRDSIPLKRLGAEARGKTGQDLELMTVDRYYQRLLEKSR
ncbi:hypothetical protein B0T10DRAFT_588772 [Thelonectria olida]|uniref:NmrA-like domain-containing protein n=1 Tax=Thelonectria olida TaxID=1576542 RepID=A0A9P8VQW8_9HYPO|nr:hypothetical protein B0T10DRAFT_588772 [Thelonectria olida]